MVKGEGYARQKRDWRNYVEKPIGGYRLIRSDELIASWQALQAGRIDLYALRVLWAQHEIAARRCSLKEGRRGEVGTRELCALIGSTSASRVRAACKALKAAGLSPRDYLAHADAPSANATSLSRAETKVSATGRPVPVPRRTLRYLAKGPRRSVQATILGHLFRCAYFHAKRGACSYQGTCKSSWIAEQFGISLSKAKSARSTLAAIGWLRLEGRSQTYWNRNGAWVEISASWNLPVRATPAMTDKPVRRDRESTPPPAFSTRRSAPPESYKEPPSRDQTTRNPAPKAAGPRTGFEAGKGRGATMRDVTLGDLRSTERLLELFADAVQARYVEDNPAARLRFVTAAERAMARGTRNPPGFFAALVRSNQWHGSLEEEDRAASRLRCIDRETPIAQPQVHPASASVDWPEPPPATTPEERRRVIQESLCLTAEELAAVRRPDRRLDDRTGRATHAWAPIASAVRGGPEVPFDGRQAHTGPGEDRQPENHAFKRNQNRREVVYSPERTRPRESQMAHEEHRATPNENASEATARKRLLDELELVQRREGTPLETIPAPPRTDQLPETE